VDRAPWERDQLLRELLVERFGTAPYRRGIDPCTAKQQAQHRRVLCEAMKNAPKHCGEGEA
jgi:hypothetical protein